MSSTNSALTLIEVNLAVQELDKQADVKDPADIPGIFETLSTEDKLNLSRQLSLDARLLVGTAMLKSGIAPSRVRLMGYQTSMSEGTPF